MPLTPQFKLKLQDKICEIQQEKLKILFAEQRYFIRAGDLRLVTFVLLYSELNPVNYLLAMLYRENLDSLHLFHTPMQDNAQRVEISVRGAIFSMLLDDEISARVGSDLSKKIINHYQCRTETLKLEDL